MAYIYGESDRPATVVDQAIRGMPPTVRKRFEAELTLMGTDAALRLLTDLGVKPAQIRKAAKTGSLKKALRKERKPVAKRRKSKKAKSARTTISKAYNVVPISAAKAARTCWNGHPAGQPGARFCVWCGQQYGLDYAGNAAWQLSKAAKAAKAPVPAARYLDLMRREPDPVRAQGWWYLAHPEFAPGHSNGGQSA